MKPEKSNAAEIAVLGAAAVDMIAQVPELPHADSIVLASQFGVCPGGANANVSVGLAKLGCRVIFIGKVGDDEGGKLLLDSFEETGVDTRGIKVINGARSASCFITIDERGNRTIVGLSGVATLEEPGELDATLLENIQALYIGDAMPDIGCLAAEIAHTGGAKVFYSVGGVMASFGLSFLQGVLKLCDVLLVSRNEASMLSGMDMPEQAVAFLANQGPQVVVETLGADGAQLLAPGVKTRVPAWQASNVADTTGAGDAFAAGLIKGYLENMDWEDAVRLGSAVAALKIGHIGARTGLPSRNQVEEFMERCKE
ncbi:MAG: carbohydrate kinase family protein [Anaerolineales bacterium]|nr:carbohydrate kinase family protein [Anaerolineales bacterium]